MVQNITAPKPKERNRGSNDSETPIRATKIALNHLGYYTPRLDEDMNDEADADFQDALYAFQRIATIALDDTDIGPGTTTDKILHQ